jgi:hypothetical protein
MNCPRLPRRLSKMAYRGPDHIETCSYKFCNVLVYRSEAVQGKDIPGRTRGWFCVHCAHILGWLSPEERQEKKREAAARAAYGDDIALDRFIARLDTEREIRRLPGLD